MMASNCRTSVDRFRRRHVRQEHPRSAALRRVGQHLRGGGNRLSQCVKVFAVRRLDRIVELSLPSQVAFTAWQLLLPSSGSERRCDLAAAPFRCPLSWRSSVVESVQRGASLRPLDILELPCLDQLTFAPGLLW